MNMSQAVYSDTYQGPLTYQLHIDPITGKEVVVNTTNGQVERYAGMQQEYDDNVGHGKLIEYFDNLSFDGIRNLYVQRKFAFNATSLDQRRAGFLSISTDPLKYAFYIESHDPYVLVKVQVHDALFEYPNNVAVISPRPDYMDESACKKMENKYFELIEAIENSLEASWEDILKNMV
jgi:hypothetical protein